MTYEEWLIEVKVNGLHIAGVPLDFRTSEMCAAAVEQNCFALAYIPNELRTAELCFAASLSSIFVYSSIPKQHRKAVEAYLKLMGVDMTQYEKYLETVKRRGANLAYVPVELIDEAMALIAVKGGAFRYVPKQFRTAHVCLAAVRQSGYALESTPVRLRTLELCSVAVQQSRWAVCDVPYKHRKTIEAYLKLIGKLP